MEWFDFWTLMIKYFLSCNFQIKILIKGQSYFWDSFLFRIQMVFLINSEDSKYLMIFSSMSTYMGWVYYSFLIYFNNPFKITY